MSFPVICDHSAIWRTFGPTLKDLMVSGSRAESTLTVWTSNQMIAWGKRDLGKALGLKPEQIRLDSPYIGGGFGGKLFLRSDGTN